MHAVFAASHPRCRLARRVVSRRSASLLGHSRYKAAALLPRPALQAHLIPLHLVCSFHPPALDITPPPALVFLPLSAEKVPAHRMHARHPVAVPVYTRRIRHAPTSRCARQASRLGEHAADVPRGSRSRPGPDARGIRTEAPARYCRGAHAAGVRQAQLGAARAQCGRHPGGRDGRRGLVARGRGAAPGRGAGYVATMVGKRGRRWSGSIRLYLDTARQAADIVPYW